MSALPIYVYLYVGNLCKKTSFRIILCVKVDMIWVCWACVAWLTDYWTFNVEYIDDIILYKHLLYLVLLCECCSLVIWRQENFTRFAFCYGHFNLNWKYFCFEWQKWLKLAKRCQVLLGQTFCWFSEFWKKKRSKYIFTKSYLYIWSTASSEENIVAISFGLNFSTMRAAVW